MKSKYLILIASTLIVLIVSFIISLRPLSILMLLLI